VTKGGIDVSNLILKYHKQIIVLLVFALAISLWYNHQFYLEKQYQAFEYRVYLNRLYFLVLNAKGTVEDLLTPDLSADQVNQTLASLTYKLNEIHFYVNESAALVEGMSRRNVMFFGLTSDIILNGNDQIPSFGGGQGLSHSEQAFFRELHKYLDDFLATISSETTGQENPLLSKSDLISAYPNLEDYHHLLYTFNNNQ